MQARKSAMDYAGTCLRHLARETIRCFLTKHCKAMSLRLCVKTEIQVPLTEYMHIAHSVRGTGVLYEYGWLIS